MAYFPDLSPYAYGRGSHPGVLHVGWLDNVHPFPQGSIHLGLIEKLKLLAAHPVELYRGKHICQLCPEPPHLVKTAIPDRAVIDPNCSWAQWVNHRAGNGEIRVRGEGVTFAAPVLIIHYIEQHSYLPPVPFLDALEQAPG